MTHRPRRRRTVIVAAASTLVVVGGVVTADLITTHAVTARVESGIACALDVPQSDVETHVDGFVPFELVAGSIGHASATAERSGATVRVDLRDVHTRGDTSAGSITAAVTVPWGTVQADAAKRAASGQDALPSGLSLADDDGTLVATLASRPGIAVAFDLDHDRSSITLTADGLVLAGKRFPLPSGLADRGGTLGALAEPHTVTPNLPKGSAITGARSTADGLRVAVDLAADGRGGTDAATCGG